MSDIKELSIKRDDFIFKAIRTDKKVGGNEQPLIGMLHDNCGGHNVTANLNI